MSARKKRPRLSTKEKLGMAFGEAINDLLNFLVEFFLTIGDEHTMLADSAAIDAEWLFENKKQSAFSKSKKGRRNYLRIEPADESKWADQLDCITAVSATTADGQVIPFKWAYTQNGAAYFNAARDYSELNGFAVHSSVPFAAKVSWVGVKPRTK